MDLCRASVLESMNWRTALGAFALFRGRTQESLRCELGICYKNQSTFSSPVPAGREKIYLQNVHF